MLSVRTSANGHGRGERSGPRTWDTFAQRIDDTPPLSPRSSAQRSTTTEKKKFGIFWQILADLGCQDRPDGPGGAPDGPELAANRRSNRLD